VTFAETSPLRRPPSIIVISVLLVLEGLGAAAVGVWYLLSIGQPGPVPMAGRIFMLALLFGAAAWQLAVGHFLFRGRAWTRAAALVWQVFQVILSVQLLGAAPLPGWALLVPAAAVILLMFDPRTTAFFGDRQGADSGPAPDGGQKRR
jgi:hypothetical protein